MLKKQAGSPSKNLKGHISVLHKRLQLDLDVKQITELTTLIRHTMALSLPGTRRPITVFCEQTARFLGKVVSTTILIFGHSD